MKEILQHVCDAFQMRGQLISWHQIICGHINKTYRVDLLREDGRQKSYILQSVNTQVFRQPEQVMENIYLVTEYIHALDPRRTVLHFFHTPEGNAYWRGEGGFWRAFNYIHSVTYDNPHDLEVVRSAGEAFGNFQTMLSKFDAEKLHETIPDFHNTPRRYDQLRQTVAQDPMGRAAQVQPELRWLLEAEDMACALAAMEKAGQLPRRVTHNDTKINNVLFDEEGRKAIVVVDLDTVMPGLVATDFGDAIRSVANTRPEDCPDTDQVRLDLPVYRAFTEGFLSQTAGSLTDQERKTLNLGCFAMTCELAVRFLQDYLQGDVYFGADYPEHNLCRARCQIALARDMLRNRDTMDRILGDCLQGR